MANKVSCRSGSGKTKVIDPNSFEGQSSSSNIPVQLEDLNISVQLQTYKKGRTVLKASNDDKNSESSKTLRVTFIEGQTLPSGKKALTTKFTDLTTVFEADNPNNDTEDLGISSIDIDFNSSYAPLVTINFIDVRGSAIFQNENNLKNGTNKYSTFFELPYPLYELTIKGYYGRPVKYCLHMTKFNSRFNSQTANFEITASFVGYTYAMLSDMLVGYLKAIPYTPEGKSVYDDINKIRVENGLSEIPYLNEYIAKLSNIDQEIKKVSSDAPAAKEIEEIDEKLSILTEIEQEIFQFGSRVEENSFQFNIKEKYPIVITSDVTIKTEDVAPSSEKTLDEDLRTVPQSDYIPQTEVRYVPNPVTQKIIDGDIKAKINKPIDEAVKNYETNVIKLVEKFNNIIGTTKLDEEDFIVNTQGHFFNNLTKNEFDEQLRTTETDEILRNKLKSAPDSSNNDGYTIFEFKVNQYNEILFRDYVDLEGSVSFSLYDMTYAYESISFNKEILNSNREKSLIELASQIDINITNKLGIRPTIRNIVEVFTVAVEAFMKTLYRVSDKAERNTERKKLLNRIFGDDIKKSSDLTSKQDIFAWPDYVENSELGYVEKYLGTVVKNTEKDIVNELEFIDALLDAFIKASKEEAATAAALNKIYTNWIPINPLDTKIFVKDAPYERLKNDASAPNKVLAMMLTRAMTFLGYSNKNLTATEIQQMSTFEANLISKLPDATLKSAIANKPVDDILKTTVDINNQSVSVLKSDGSNYYYNMLFDGSSDDKKLIPISYKNLNNWEKNKVYTIGQTNNYFNSGSLYFSKPDTFLTNYSPNQTDDEDNPYYKDNDGGLYVQILSVPQYETPKLTLVEEVNTESVILLDKIKVQSDEEIQALSSNLSSAGFNTFGGLYGIQEFSKMNFGNSTELDGLPLMYVFYGDYLKNGLAYNSLSYNNLDISIETGFEYPYDNDGPVNIILDRSDISSRRNDFEDFSKNRKLFNSIKKDASNSNVGYPFLNYETVENQFNTALFGTRWYYSQESEFVKAMLFLNTLPFNNTKIGDITNVSIEAPEIARLFDQKSGFIRVPRLWCAFIGSILWRYEQGDNDVIIWKKPGNVFLFPSMYDNNSIPKTDEYIKYIDISNVTDYQKVNDKLVNLPIQVIEEFKRVFFDFVTGSDSKFYTSWATLKNKLEIWDGNGDSFHEKLISLSLFVPEGSIPKEQFNDFKNLEEYNIATIYDDTKNYMYLELYGNYKTNSRKNTSEYSVPRLIIDAMMEEVVITNNDYKIWGDNIVNGGEFSPILVSSEILTTYVNNIKSILAEQYENPTTERKNTEQQIFGTTNEDVIKLQLYRTCKNIYDKWIGGVTKESELLYQCGTSSNPNPRRNSDTNLASRLNTNTDSLISSFRFVSRSFSDIGDKFYVNPLPIADIIKINPNASFYDIISRILSDNNFDFIALPTYIDYSNDEELSDVFQPFPKYAEAIEGGVCGPSFVCVYVGQTSKNLDFNNDKNSYYSNDGFDIRCLNGSSIDSDLPVDFTNTLNAYEDPVSVFNVNFGQQNQNIFKDIVLDQSEFAETAESLKIIDDISTKGSQNNVTLAGQNIYNVYSVRSYKAEVEMMGNAMIQPMMYFQLNNIPMFHGAYMITHVKHAIKPNYMSTHFTGVRIKKAETPLLTAADLYMSFLDSLGIASSSSSGIATANNYIIDYYNDLLIQDSISPINELDDSSIISIYLNDENFAKNIETRALEELNNWQNGELDEKEGVVFLDKYAEATPGFSGEDFASNATPWSAAFLSYIMLAGDPNFPKSNRHYDYVTAAMKGDNGYEAFPLKSGLKIYGEVGDIFCKKRAGKYTYSHCDVVYGYDLESLEFLLIGGNLTDTVKITKIPIDAEQSFLYELFYDQKAIKDYQIIIKKTNNKYYGGKNLINKRFALGESSSAYPTGSSADYWSLVAVCALESDTKQGRCDVAQSIYNRVLSGIYGASSIKNLIIIEKQYEPVGRAMTEFKQINSKETAIKAVMKSKEYSYETAKSAIDATETVLNDATLVASSKDFVGGRTDFYSASIKNKEPYKTTLANGIGLKERDNQIFGWFVGPGALKYGSTNPPAANKPDFSGVVS
jgi:hypothetical protein